MKLNISPAPCGDTCCCFTGMYWDTPCPECGAAGQLHGFGQYLYWEMEFYGVDPAPITARCTGCGAAWRCENPTGSLFGADEWEWERIQQEEQR